MMSRTIPITVTFPVDLLKEVDRMAKSQKVSRSNIVADAVRRRAWLWRLSRLQKRARPYAARLRIRTETDLDKLLAS